MTATRSITIVIPALDEAEVIGEAVSHALSLGDVEVVVVDDGNSDATTERALRAGARVVHSREGRGVRLDAGAEAAFGEVLLFLDPGTRLPEDAVDHIRAALADPEIVGGNFYLRFVPFSRAAMALTAAMYLRRSLLAAYGSVSGLFVRRSVYERLGGFGDRPAPERSFTRRMKKAGRTGLIPAWAEAVMPPHVRPASRRSGQ